MSGPLVIVTPDELTRLVREAVAAELDERATDDTAPVLVDRAGLARALSLSVGSVDKLRAQGLPEVQLGLDSPRFHVPTVLEWLQRGDR